MKKISTLLIFVTSVGLTGVLLSVITVDAMPPDTAAGSTLQQRIDQRKAEQKVKLDAKQLARYAQRCASTQNITRTLQDQLNPIVINRAKVYQQIDGKIWIAIGQLKLAEKDTFNLEKQRATLAAKVAEYDKTMANYKQTLDDITVMNCKADVEGFVALVATARQYHEEIRKQVNDIKAYTVDTIKISLSDFSTALQPKAATEQEGGDE
jgi:hypothetical protein